MGEDGWREIARFKPEALCLRKRTKKSVDRMLRVSLNRLDGEKMKTLESCRELEWDFPVQPVS